ncbi:hypothetical protein L1987_61372 [Smallanthus sonchifolius]|uniref:Uncharacterized protein n=1 Tax=Smallanthus sonchifolius TaxID=185202 RepID=A0ACB9DB12_9ASTR|nr:hypothetical protein L1987_61372 [Smallanthus sonchifolius]
MLRLRWPDCGASMASNGNLSPILPMQETINLLLLLFGLALGLCGSWWWTNIRDFRVERAWLEKLSPMRILFMLTDFLFPSLNLSGGGLDNYWVGLECVRQTYNSVYSSVESSIGEVGANKCFCGVGCGMGWNRFCFGLLPIPIVWSRWKRKWATSYGEKRELLHNELGYTGCPKFKRINHEGLDDYAPRSNWSVRPRNLALLGTKIQSEGMGCDHRTDAKFEPPPSGLFGVSINILLSGFWRLMVLDLINLLGWVDKNRSHQSGLIIRARLTIFIHSSPQSLMPRKKEPPPSALPSRQSTRGNNRVSTDEEISDLAPLVMPVVGFGSIPEVEARVPQPPLSVTTSELEKDSRPNMSATITGMLSIPAVNVEKDACQVNKEQSTVPGSDNSSEASSASVRDMDSTAHEIGWTAPVGRPSSAGMVGKINMETTEKSGSVGSVGLAPTGNFPTPTPLKCGVFGHNDDVHKPPPPTVEHLVMDTPTLAPPVATTKGKEILDDGFIKVVKKKKKPNGPKHRVQIPGLKVSKPGPKPMGRASQVRVSNPFSALDDTIQTEDCFPELNATLKKFAMRYVEEKTIPDPDVFKTWSKDLQEYYYSLINDDGETVESETDGTAKLMSMGVP